jgi:hypothetical protein
MAAPVRKMKFSPAVVGPVLLGSLILLGGLLALGPWRSVLQTARRPARVLFDAGLSPVHEDLPAGWSNDQCGSCHQGEYEQWKRSRHYTSATNENFRIECLDPEGGRLQFCINCHAPMNPGHDKFPTSEPAQLDSWFQQEPDWLTQGVDCITCHVRDGTVLATKVSDKGRVAHPMRLAPELARADFCSGCHQFSFKTSQLPDSFFGDLQQASMEEFLEFRQHSGLDLHCQDCHMPDGDHLMPGGYHLSMLQQAVDMELAATWSEQPGLLQITVDLTASEVGHRVPGGEHFRFLELETTVLDADGKTVVLPIPGPPRSLDNHNDNLDSDPRRLERLPHIERMQRNLNDKGRGHRALPDDRLRPEETKTFRYLVQVPQSIPTESLTVHALVRYHLMSDDKARLFGHDFDDVTTVIREATVEPK